MLFANPHKTINKWKIIGPKDWRKTLKAFIKPTQELNVLPLHDNGVTYTDEEGKANLLNDFFFKL